MMIYTGNSKQKPIKGYIWWTIVELAERGYISQEQPINQEFLDKIRLEELIDIDKIGVEVAKRTQEKEYKVRDVVILSNGFVGEIVNINDLREPSMKYAVDIGENDIHFVGEGQIVRKVEENNGR